MGIYCIHTLLLLCAAGHWKKNNQVPGSRDYQPYLHHQLTTSSSSRRLLLVVMGVAVVVVAAVNCGGGGDGHLYVAVVLFVVVKFYLWYILVCTWYLVPEKEGFCADAHRLNMKAIRIPSYCLYCTIIGLTEFYRFNKLKQIKTTLHYPFSRPDRGVYSRGVF